MNIEKLKMTSAFFWESTFTLWLKAVKNTDYIKKHYKQNLFGIQSPTKISVDVRQISPDITRVIKMFGLL